MSKFPYFNYREKEGQEKRDGGKEKNLKTVKLHNFRIPPLTYIRTKIVKQRNYIL